MSACLVGKCAWVLNIKALSSMREGIKISEEKFADSGLFTIRGILYVFT